jgi:hypothetical protein
MIRKELLLLLAVASSCFALPYAERLEIDKIGPTAPPFMDEISTLVTFDPDYLKSQNQPLHDIKNMLEASSLGRAVSHKVLTSLQCANGYNVAHNNILTVIDYSRPSNEKRLWIFDLRKKKLLFYTYVSHGLNSGVLSTTYFSNKNNSKASSIGVYKTEKSYRGRHGLSLQLEGLDAGFNDNASRRAVVMHGGWYVEESFIKKYGRAGRSWGCPAVPDQLSEAIINTIKEEALLVIYYPNENWLVKSKFQTCKHSSPIKAKEIIIPEVSSLGEDNQIRDGILFADLNKNSRRDENNPIIVITADNYLQTFHKKAPLERMLRRQINQVEYIALSKIEFKNMLMTQKNSTDSNAQQLNTLSFVIPVVKMDRGYYATEMKLINFGKITNIKPTSETAPLEATNQSYTINFESHSPITLKTTDQFIRWLGL